jgi:hypothetical protein
MNEDPARSRGVLRHLKGNVVAYVALFFALTGAAYAGKPLLTGAQIEDDTVASVDIKDGDLRAVDVAPDGLTGAVIDESTLTLPSSDTVTRSHHWGVLFGPTTGTTWSIGDWTVTPSCSSSGLAFDVTGPSGYTNTKDLGYADWETTMSPVFPGIAEPALTSSLLLTIDYTAQNFIISACAVTVVGSQVAES